jgi:hypothetical protein
MSIHEHLPPQTKGNRMDKRAGAEAKLAEERAALHCALGVHKAREMQTENFRREVEKMAKHSRGQRFGYRVGLNLSRPRVFGKYAKNSKPSQR